MVKFDEAVLILKSLPAQQQEAAINVILDIASQPNDVQLTDEQAAEMERRLNDPSVELISLDEFRARVAKIGSCES